MRTSTIRIIALTLMLSLVFFSDLADARDSDPSRTETNDDLQIAPTNSLNLEVGASVDVTVYFFWGQGCSHCAAVKPFIDQMAAKYPQVTFLYLEIYHNTSNYWLFKEFNARFGITNTAVPSVFIENVAAMVGEEAIWANLESNILIAIGPPTAPGNLVATAADANIVLSWNAASDKGGAPITNYYVYRGITPNGETLIATLGNVLTYNSAGLINGVTYYYKVSAVNSVGEGPQSNEASATPVGAPSAPTLNAATAGNGHVVLAWTAPGNNGGSSVSGYKVYRGTTSNGETLLATFGNVLAYNSTGLTNGVTYYYKVSAVNSVGEGALSNELSAIPANVPSSPTLDSATSGNSQVVLGWSAPANNGGASITGYNIYRGTISGGEALLASTGVVLTYLDANVSNGVTYYYIVRAVNSMGEGAPSTEMSARPVGPPAPPQNLQASPGDAYIYLSWQAPANDGGSPVTNYEVWRGPSSGTETFLTDVGTNLWYNNSGLVNGQTYYFVVKAENGQGSSSSSNEVHAQPSITALLPNSPQNLVATAGNGNIVLTWSVPVSDGGATITSYEVYRGTSSGQETPLITLGNVLSYTNTGLTNGQTYYYKVSAVNSVGEGPRSNEASATPVTSPSALALELASPGINQIVLSWSAPFDTGGASITAYKVYRGNTSGSEVLIATLGNVLTYTDTGLTNGQTYYYKVSAVNSVGEGPRSNEASATPYGVPSAPTLTSVTPKNGYINLAWTTPSYTGPGEIFYHLFRDGTEVWNGTATEKIDSGLSNGVTYTYYLVASNRIGWGPNSSAVQAAPTAEVTDSEELTIGMVLVAAVIDSINPCAISVMIFLLMFLTSLGSKRRVLFVGIAYIATVFTVYFMAGMGLLTFLHSTSMTSYVYYAAAFLSIVIGIINIKDYIFPGEKPTVAISESRKPMIKKWIEKASIPGAVGLGALVSLFELPCTGGIYLAILSLLGNEMTFSEGIPWLALYNLIFVLPLAAILVLIYFGVSAEKANEWRLEKRSMIRLAIGVIMLALGLMMLFGVF